MRTIYMRVNNRREIVISEKVFQEIIRDYKERKCRAKIEFKIIPGVEPIRVYNEWTELEKERLRLTVYAQLNFKHLIPLWFIF